jgi:hypothetical protein
MTAVPCLLRGINVGSSYELAKERRYFAGVIPADESMRIYFDAISFRLESKDVALFRTISYRSSKITPFSSSSWAFTYGIHIV